MGINGLLQNLKSVAKPTHVQSYKGLKVVIDGYSWLHKGAYSCSRELCEGVWTDGYVRYFMSRIEMLLSNGITPIVCFDGCSLPMKADENDTRRRGRREAMERAAQHMAAGNVTAAVEQYQRAVDVSPRMAKVVIEALRERGVKWVVAPYEADAQMASLALSGEVDVVITEDSDLLAYGCPRVLFKLDRAGWGEEVQSSELMFAKELPLQGFTHDMFLQMCILAGCDFLPNLPGLGMKKAHGLIKKHRDFVKVVRALRFQGSTTIPRDYETRFQRTLWLFRHMRVYCSTARALVHVRPLPPGGLGAADVDVPSALPTAEEDPGGSLGFLGPDMDPQLALGIAEGDTDPSSKRPFDLVALYRGCPAPPQHLRHLLPPPAQNPGQQGQQQQQPRHHHHQHRSSSGGGSHPAFQQQQPQRKHPWDAAVPVAAPGPSQQQQSQQQFFARRNSMPLSVGRSGSGGGGGAAAMPSPAPSEPRASIKSLFSKQLAAASKPFAPPRPKPAGGQGQEQEGGEDEGAGPGPSSLAQALADLDGEAAHDAPARAKRPASAAFERFMHSFGAAGAGAGAGAGANQQAAGPPAPGLFNRFLHTAGSGRGRGSSSAAGSGLLPLLKPNHQGRTQQGPSQHSGGSDASEGAGGGGSAGELSNHLETQPSSDPANDSLDDMHPTASDGQDAAGGYGVGGACVAPLGNITNKVQQQQQHGALGGGKSVNALFWKHALQTAPAVGDAGSRHHPSLGRAVPHRGGSSRGFVIELSEEVERGMAAGDMHAGAEAEPEAEAEAGAALPGCGVGPSGRGGMGPLVGRGAAAASILLQGTQQQREQLWWASAPPGSGRDDGAGAGGAGAGAGAGGASCPSASSQQQHQTQGCAAGWLKPVGVLAPRGVSGGGLGLPPASQQSLPSLSIGLSALDDIAAGRSGSAGVSGPEGCDAHGDSGRGRDGAGSAGGCEFDIYATEHEGGDVDGELDGADAAHQPLQMHKRARLSEQQARGQRQQQQAGSGSGVCDLTVDSDDDERGGGGGGQFHSVQHVPMYAGVARAALDSVQANVLVSYACGGGAAAAGQPGAAAKRVSHAGASAGRAGPKSLLTSSAATAAVTTRKPFKPPRRNSDTAPLLATGAAAGGMALSHAPQAQAAQTQITDFARFMYRK